MEIMVTVLLVLQITLSVLIVGCILLQAQGTGLGTTWGGGGETYHTKRGVEKVVYYLTIALVAIFIVVSMLSVTL